MNWHIPDMVRLLNILILCIWLVGTCGANIQGVETTEPFAQSLALDPDSNYLLFWNFNDTHVTFEVHVRTKGWVGFGFSDNGNMYPADVAIGWIDSEGGHHFADRHTTEHAMPQKDKSQDWFLLAALEDDFGTVLKFQRKKDTCDAAEDKVIQEGTSRIIYAYGKEDPASDDDIQYHGSTRGTRSVALFNADTVTHTLPDDIIHFDFLNYNFIIPNDTTTYWCRGFTLPDIGKHHLIEFEPVITPGNELNVHHILLYRCSSPDPSLIEGKAGPCYINRPSDLPKCQDVFLAWAIGGQAFYFPENVGLPVGDPDESVYYITETHYDNPTRRTDVLDNSGLRITLTPNLRPQDAGIIMAGQNVNRYQVVPPYQEAFNSKGYCSQDCLNKSMSQEDVEEIKVFAACQHAHLLGEEIKTRHFRDGKEIEPIIVDPSYDFNFQETLHLPSERIVKNTDSIQVDCVYNSRGRDRATYGGFSTQEEMCLTFLYYYPLLPVTQCTSTQTLMPFVKNLKETTAVYNAMDWDNATAVEMLTQVMQDSVVNHNCIGTKLEIPQKERTVKFVEQEPKDPYIPPDHGCFD